MPHLLITEDQYEDFSKITHRSLNHALAESGVHLNEQDTTKLMQAYNTLSIFTDVGPALERLKQVDYVEAYVFSNGTNEMVSSSVQQSPDLKPHSSVFKGIVVVEEVKKFKPHPETYYHLAKTVGKDPTSEKDMSEMWLVSGNPFDIVGARAVGMKAAWVDRAGNGWQDAVVPGETGRPSVIAKSLEEVITALSKR
jgi:2-haloacid dehalogenase